MSEARSRPFRRVVLAPNRDPGLALAVARILTRGGVEVTRTTAPFTSASARGYLGGAAGRRSFPAGSYVIDLDQPRARLATALLEPRAVVDSAFARRQLDRFERNRRRGEAGSTEGYEFYDITAWALPFSFGLDAAWTEDAPAVTGERVGLTTVLAAGSVSGRARSAYVFAGGREASARLAMYLLNEGFSVGAATQEIRADGTTWPVGTYVSRVQRNRPALHERIQELATRTGVQVVAVQSAYADSGMGVGSEQIQTLRAPKILLAGGEGFSQPSFGSVWFHLERELEYPVVTVDLGSLGRVNLADYNVLILPDGSAGTMFRRLPSADRLKQFVQGGGAVIAFGGAAQLLARKELELASVGLVGQTEEGAADKKPTATDTTLSPSARPGPPLVSATAPGAESPEGVPGIIVRGTLDRTHWLTFGYDSDQLPVLVSGDFLRASRRGDNPVAFVGSDLVLSGFVWPGNTERLLSGAVWAVVENNGAGKVVLFAEDPLFRAFWRGTAGLFHNALLMATGR
jgi:hypothetical protein